MLYSSKHKFLFIHIYKNAGTSIKKSLHPYCDTYRKREIIEKFCKKLLRLNLNLAPNSHIRAYEAKKLIGDKKWEDLYTFGVVRNPWDWQVSLYTYATQERNHFQHELFSSFHTFDQYICWRCSNDITLQSEFVTDKDGCIIVNDIFRFERLEDDFQRIAARVNQDIKLPHLNKSVHNDYRSYYSKKSEKLVLNYFAKDIELFQYSF